MEYTRRILKIESKKTFNEKKISRKTIPKIGSMIVHGKDIRKQNIKMKQTILKEIICHKNLSKRLYQ